MAEDAPLSVEDPSLAVATGKVVKGRRLLTRDDVDAILSRLQWRGGGRGEEGEGDEVRALEGKGLSKEDMDAMLSDPDLPTAMREVQKLVPDVPLVGLAPSTPVEDEEAVPPPDFCTPTAVEDIFATLSDMGRGIDTIAKSERKTAAAAATEPADGAGAAAAAKEPDAEVDRTFAGVRLDLPDGDAARLHEIMQSNQHSSETVQQMEEALAIEHWETVEKKQCEHRVLCPNRTFLDSDIVSYPRLLGADGRHEKPETSGVVMSICEDPTYSWADARLHLQSATESHDAYARDIDELLELQNAIATIENRQVDRKHDVDRRRRQCEYVHTTQEYLPLAGTRGPYVFDCTDD